MSDLEQDENFSRDPEAAELAKRLARTDFSAGGPGRERLKARLLAGGRVERPTRAFRRAAAVCLAAAAVVLGFPLTQPRIAPAVPRYARGEHGLPVLPGRLPALGGRGEDAVIQTARASVAATARGRAITWRIDGATYVLETRRTSLEEIFTKPKI